MFSMQLICIVTIICILIIIFSPCESGYADYTTQRLASKLLWLHRELSVEAVKSADNVKHMRNIYANTEPFIIGGHVYLLRKKYQQMLILYFKSVAMNDMADKDNGEKMAVNLVRIGDLKIDIDNLINMLEDSYSNKDTRLFSPEDEHHKDLRANKFKVVPNEDIVKAANKLALHNQMKKIQDKQALEVKQENHADDGFDTE